MVGFALARPNGPDADWELDTLVMSCRVIGRKVETVLLADLLREVAERGGRSLSASYVGGPRNDMCRGFLGDSGFTPLAEQTGPDGLRYRYDLAAAPPAVPDFIEVIRSDA